MTAKRLFDLAVSIAAGLLLLPVFITLVIAIKIDSRGPVFYFQERVGRGFSRFNIIKFRTMRPEPANAGPQITVKGDPRITRLGRYIRKWKLDELPQLLNVVRGEMSIVGPRPEVPIFVDLFRNDYDAVLTVRPGMTDLASLQFLDEEDILFHAGPDPQRAYTELILPVKLKLAHEYVRRQSFWLDVYILFRTAMAMLFGLRRR
jgi:lipopolysaccharide/colanic/teichoic acid biosynthesis glycosyltransferase